MKKDGRWVQGRWSHGCDRGGCLSGAGVWEAEVREEERDVDLREEGSRRGQESAQGLDVGLRVEGRGRMV